MVNKQIEEFYSKNANEIIKKIGPEFEKEKTSDLTPLFKQVQVIAKKHGYNFSVEELVDYEKN